MQMHWLLTTLIFCLTNIRFLKTLLYISWSSWLEPQAAVASRTRSTQWATGAYAILHFEAYWFLYERKMTTRDNTFFNNVNQYQYFVPKKISWDVYCTELDIFHWEIHLSVLSEGKLMPCINYVLNNRRQNICILCTAFKKVMFLFCKTAVWLKHQDQSSTYTTRDSLCYAVFVNH